jgi:hypothetical protein
MKKTILMLTAIVLSIANCKTQNLPVVLNAHGQAPLFFGGKGKMLSDWMLGVSYERILSNEKFTSVAGFGILNRLLPTKYKGITVAEKYDYGSYNQAMPATIPVNYYYRQKSIGLQAFLDMRYHTQGVVNGGSYFGGGFGVEALRFISSTEKHDDYNYIVNTQKDKYAPYDNTAGTDFTKYMTVSINIRGIVGYGIKLSETKQFFVECIGNFRFNKKDSAPVENVYSHKLMLAPAAGFKVLLPT